MFTDSYGEQSCTAGRSSFITGQSVYRSGLSKVGYPGAPIGMSEKLVTIAACLKNQGYATGQFGKNHLGDLNHMLPTNHGFDEFYGNLYHLDAEEEPEMADYPSEKEFPNFRKTFGPRGVIHSWATDTDDATVDPRWGKVGKQKIEDTGPLTKKRMETCDDEFVAAAKDFIKRQNDAGKPFSSGSTPRICISSRIPSRRAKARRDDGSRLTTTRWSTTTRSSARCSTISMNSASPTTRS